MKFIGIKAKKASKIKIDSKSKNRVLIKFLQLIEKNEKIILRENNKDIKRQGCKIFLKFFYGLKLFLF